MAEREMSGLSHRRLCAHQGGEMLVGEHLLDGANAIWPLGMAFRRFVTDGRRVGQKQRRHARVSLRVSFADPFTAKQDLAGAPGITLFNDSRSRREGWAREVMMGRHERGCSG